MGICHGTSAQPFKTEKDYTNFLKRWIGTASGLIRQWFTWKGIEKELLPKALTVKMIPQFADMPTATIEDNLFYSSIKLMPSTFSETKGFNWKYTATINDKLIPQFKKMTAFLKTNTRPHHENKRNRKFTFEKNYMPPMRDSGPQQKWVLTKFMH
jgi:uncharacterized protein (DUF885 family)